MATQSTLHLAVKPALRVLGLSFFANLVGAILILTYLT